MRNWMPVLVVLVLLALGVACGDDGDSGQEQNMAREQGAAVVSPVGADIKTNCTKCHGIGKLCAKIGEFGMPDWGATIGFMMSKGAVLTTASVTQAAEFLADPAQARPALCE